MHEIEEDEAVLMEISFTLQLVRCSLATTTTTTMIPIGVYGNLHNNLNFLYELNIVSQKLICSNY